MHHPINSPSAVVARRRRETAHQAGHISYEGLTCIRDPAHGGIRYVKGNLCVACSDERNAARHKKVQAAREKARHAARAAGHATYEGAPCPECGGTTRLVRSRACPSCSAARYERSVLRDIAYRAEHDWVNEPRQEELPEADA